jgi:hypothetical protein
MKKVFGFVGLIMFSAMIATGCVPQDKIIQFEGKQLPTSQVEEILEDRLEEDNGIDYEVSIIEETED